MTVVSPETVFQRPVLTGIMDGLLQGAVHLRQVAIGWGIGIADIQQVC
jgi:alpha-acetolactate decarboxylase